MEYEILLNSFHSREPNGHLHDILWRVQDDIQTHLWAASRAFLISFKKAFAGSMGCKEVNKSLLH